MPDLYQECKCPPCQAARWNQQLSQPEKPAKDSIPSGTQKASLGSAVDAAPSLPGLDKANLDCPCAGACFHPGDQCHDVGCTCMRPVGVWTRLSTWTPIDKPEVLKWPCGCAVGGAKACGLQDETTAPKEQGLKYDDGKPPMDLLPGEALEAIAQVLAFGAKKYGRDNWRKGFNWSRLLGAGLRHLSAFGRGERKDPESGLSHLAHAGAMLLFLLTHEVTGIGTDDLYKGNENATAK